MYSANGRCPFINIILQKPRRVKTVSNSHTYRSLALVSLFVFEVNKIIKITSNFPIASPIGRMHVFCLVRKWLLFLVPDIGGVVALGPRHEVGSHHILGVIGRDLPHSCLTLTKMILKHSMPWLVTVTCRVFLTTFRLE